MSRLDTDIRDAFEALERSTPEDTFDELPVRVAQRLQEEEAQMEGTPRGDRGDRGETMSKRGSDTPPPGTTGTTENTGLHDIKALARTTKQRISKRHSTQSEAEEALLASSSSALSAVALPEPGKDKQRYATGERPVVDAAPAAAAAEAESRGGMPVWIYAAVAVVAAAAVVVFMVRGRGGAEAEKPAADQVALNESAPAAAQGTTPPGAAPAEPADPEPVVGAIGEDDDSVATEPTEVAAAETTSDEGAAPAADRGDDQAERKSASRTSAARTETATKTTAPSKSAKSDKTDTAKSKSSTTGSADTDSKATEGSAGEGDSQADADKSIDDLLSEATGVSGEGGGGAGGSAGPAKPTKKELTRSDIQAGMRKVMGTARACGAEHSAAGQVMVSLTIASSGKVSAAKATGEFAGTPVGNCVVAAVKGASFPAWDGPPHSMSYPFLVTE